MAYEVVDRFLQIDASTKGGEQDALTSFRNERKRFDERIAAAIAPNPSGAGFRRPLQDYVASFRCPMYGDATVALEDNHLVLRMLPADQLVADLAHLHYDTFQVNWREDFAWFGSGTVHFIQDPQGQFSRLELNIPNDDLWFYELNFERQPE